MSKVNEPTPRDLEVLANVDHFSVVHGRSRSTFSIRVEAFAHARDITQNSPRGAIVYAVGEACGTMTSAMIGIVRAGQWPGLEG